MGVKQPITPSSASRRAMGPAAIPAAHPSMASASIPSAFTLPLSSHGCTGQASAPPLHTYAGAIWLGPGPIPFPTMPVAPTAPVIPAPPSVPSPPVMTAPHTIPAIQAATAPTVPVPTMVPAPDTMPSTPIGPSASPSSVSPSVSFGSSSSFEEELDKFATNSLYFK
ncbi:hypothetical protein M422DRAFT_48610 [Sphaerobolus stellatus SS14]|uniref:Uncharacterized protein n=1 Tax=Sphaerobolus stellatus (strain SS14) TaxID=990650 RepID=A0A0C9VJ30_SPHS4|nr:hypothetical protein M422DRAFT_48610 [Sphaerobolus stellatus SS14]